MRYAKMLGLTLLAVFALSAVMVSGASAAEGELLGASGSAESKDTGTATFESTGGGVTVKCTSSKGEVKATNNVSGTFTEHFKGCTAAGIKCTGLLAGEATGEITASGTTEVLAFKNEKSELKLAVVYTINNVHFECLGILTEVRGSVIGEITNANGAKTKTINSTLSGKEGKETLTTVNGQNHHLESETGGSAFAESDQNQVVSATGETEVEVMY